MVVIKQIRSILCTLFFISVFLLLPVSNVSAQVSYGSCTDALNGGTRPVTVSGLPGVIPENNTRAYTLNFTGLPQQSFGVQCRTEYCNIAGFFCRWDVSSTQLTLGSVTGDSRGNASLTVENAGCWDEPGRKHQISLLFDFGDSYCEAGEFDVGEVTETYTCDPNTFVAYTALRPDNSGVVGGCFEKNERIYFRVQVNSGSGSVAGETFSYTPANKDAYRGDYLQNATANAEGYVVGSIDTSTNHYETGETIGFTVYNTKGAIPGCENLTVPFPLVAPSQCSADERDRDPGLVGPTPFSLCGQLVAGTKSRQACDTCRSKDGIWTAVGCINSDPAIIIATLVRLGIGIGGGVALLLILAAAFLFTTSQGDPNKTKEAKELLQSAIIGLLFIIFSVAILQFLGAGILKIPGFATA